MSAGAADTAGGRPDRPDAMRRQAGNSASVTRQREPWPERRRLALLGVGAVVLCVAAVASVARRLAPPPSLPAAPLVAIDPASVRAIDVRRGEASGHFTRSGSGWEVEVGGRRERVDPELPEGLLRSLAGLGRLGEFTDPDLAAFGLDPPRGEIVIEDGGKTRVVLGDRNPPLTALYVRALPRSEIVLVGSVLLWEFEKLAGLVARQAVRPAAGTDSALGR